jgi:hypothetical protein
MCSNKYHALGACLSPYKVLFNLQTWESLPCTSKPSNCSIYTSSSMMPLRKVVFTSIWRIFDPISTVIKITAHQSVPGYRGKCLIVISGSTCTIQGEFRDSSPTQLRGRQGASFAWLLVRFRRRNHLGRVFQTLGVRHFGRTHPGFPSDHQIRSRETPPIHLTVGRGNHFETHLSRFRWCNH